MNPNDRSVESMWGVMWGAEGTGKLLYLKINFLSAAQTLRRRTRSPCRPSEFGAGSILVTGAPQMTMLVDLDVALRAARLSS
jgi:hypothetical protein